MRGSMRERTPGVWEVRAESGRDPLTQRRRQVSQTVRGTKRDAQKVLSRLTAEADEGKHTGTDATFKEVAERWLSLAAGDLSPTTVRRYGGLLKSHINPAIGDRPIHRIRTSDLDDLYQGLIKERGLSPASVRQVHATIRRAMSQAVRWGWIAANPAANTTPPRVRANTITPPDVDQVLELLAAGHEHSPEFGRFIHLAVTTGARRGELCALKWSSVDTAAGTLTIGRAIVEIEGGLYEKDTKTHAIRRIALDGQSLAVLADHRSAADELATAAEVELSADAYVFTFDPAGAAPWTPDYVTKTFQRLRSSVGLPAVRLHDLRHFAATSLLAAGVPVRTVSGRLGHANAATTLGVYAHFLQAADCEAADLMGRMIPGPPSIAPTQR